MSRAGPTDTMPRGEAGYTYAALLIVLVALALGAQAAVIPTTTVTRRAQEEELIHRGLAYALAIESYWRAESLPAFPPNLDALLDDPRAEGRRHIRRLLDPVIATEWRLLQAEGGGIAGVQPVSGEAPFRRGDYPAGLFAPEDADAYSEWEFRFDPDDGN